MDLTRLGGQISVSVSNKVCRDLEVGLACFHWRSFDLGRCRLIAIPSAYRSCMLPFCGCVEGGTHPSSSDGCRARL